MNDNDPRHQKYLEPVIRFLLTDVELMLSPEFPEEHKKHRLHMFHMLLSRTVADIDKAVEEENKKMGFPVDRESLAQAVARIEKRTLEMFAGLPIDDVPLFLKSGATADKLSKPTYHAADCDCPECQAKEVLNSDWFS